MPRASCARCTPPSAGARSRRSVPRRPARASRTSARAAPSRASRNCATRRPRSRRSSPPRGGALGRRPLARRRGRRAPRGLRGRRARRPAAAAAWARPRSSCWIPPAAPAEPRCAGSPSFRAWRRPLARTRSASGLRSTPRRPRNASCAPVATRSTTSATRRSAASAEAIDAWAASLTELAASPACVPLDEAVLRATRRLAAEEEQRSARRRELAVLRAALEAEQSDLHADLDAPPPLAPWRDADQPGAPLWRLCDFAPGLG